MGTWDDAPWDNDTAADWFGDTFDATKLAEHVEEAQSRDIESDHQVIRAAASVLLFLGRVYVWPIDDLDRHLELAAAKLETTASQPWADEVMHVDAVRVEAALLRARMKKGATARDETLDAAWVELR